MRSPHSFSAAGRRGDVLTYYLLCGWSLCLRTGVQHSKPSMSVPSCAAAPSTLDHRPSRSTAAWVRDHRARAQRVPASSDPVLYLCRSPRGLSQHLPSAPEVRVELPSYRPASVIPLLSGVATRLSSTGVVEWTTETKRRQLLHRTLTSLGWVCEHTHASGRTHWSYRDSPAPELPLPGEITVQLGQYSAALYADYGVFPADL
jgi:hypothetical protein